MPLHIKNKKYIWLVENTVAGTSVADALLCDAVCMFHFHCKEWKMRQNLECSMFKMKLFKIKVRSLVPSIYLTLFNEFIDCLQLGAQQFTGIFRTFSLPPSSTLVFCHYLQTSPHSLSLTRSHSYLHHQYSVFSLTFHMIYS